jgi:tetratricopeptide (TPR) repeat protein
VGGKALAELPADDGSRYWAFISYSHRDAAFGRRLHRQLENYALPRRLVGRETAQGTVPRKLAPIFRDREEFAAAHDLSAEVRAALKQSRCLIVVCSPASAGSQWVSREITLFRELHPDCPILAAVRDGEPHECFPPALLGQDASGAAIEPLAADFRRGRDGEHLALLKLVAGVLGLGLDELVQRDATRRNRRVTAVTAGALVAMVVMGVLTAFALNARSEADRQRAEAEGLVEYMLTDLRDKLKGVGRLDVMTAVNERALKYYGDQDLSRLPVDSLERRARILRAMGEDDETRGDEHAAQAEYLEASRTTATMLAEMPNDPERIYDHAQSEFFLGSHEYNSGDFGHARVAFQTYKSLADRLVAISPLNSKYRQEVSYADSNLCAVAEQKPIDPTAAIQYCTDSLTETEQAARGRETDPAIVSNLVERHAWLADAYFFAGDFARARSERLTEEKLLNPLIAADPRNLDLRDSWTVMEFALAEIDQRQGDTASALPKLEAALETVETMLRVEPANQQWTKTRAAILKDLVKFNQSKRKDFSR